jgi:signal transduction histidine kinase
MSSDVFILIIASVLNFFLSASVLLRNPRNIVNRLFAAFGVSIILWTAFNFLADNASGNNLLFTELTLLFGAFLAIAILGVSYVFPTKIAIGKRFLYFYYAVTVLISASIFSGLVVESITKTSTGVELEVGALYNLYAAYLVLTLGLVIKNFIKQYRLGNKSQKNQVRLFTTGVVIYAVFAIASNVILPVIIENWASSKYGPIFTVPFVAITAYAMVRHKLFDIRLVVARTFGYLLSVGALAGLYGLISFGVINIILSESSSLNVQRGTYTLLAVVLAFTFQPLKRFFDRWSNKLFYRDAYDSQVLLDGLNKVLVSTIELDKLLINSAQVITANLKTDFILFGIKEINASPQRILGTVAKDFSNTDIQEVRNLTPKMKMKTIVADELDDEHTGLRDVMRRNDIAVLVRLTDTPSKKTEGLGYIVLGNKKSGSPYTRQDIQVLEIIADELVIAIQNALRFEEIKNFNVTLQDKVDDATKQLRKANQRLVELDQTKDDFISMASHQLRTPLTSIKGYVSMVMEGDAGKITKKQSELLDQAFVSSQRMVYLIADLLNVSRLRTGKFIIEAKETNLADVIEGEISQLKETAKGRNLELTYDKPKGFPNLMLDETKIRQVIMNFADNAIYYTPQGGHIQVNLEDKGDAIEFTVVDDGIGVPKSEQHNLFNKFYRAGNAKKARPDGTGLGLFMAKKVVVAQGGSIIFKTEENKGSTFGFSFTKKSLLPENFKGAPK